MLRTRNDQPTLWESVLPPEVLRMPAELARVDALLDDERFFAPFRAYFDLAFGRPSIPVETYLRLMFLKVRYRLGYESEPDLVRDEVHDDGPGIPAVDRERVERFLPARQPASAGGCA